MGVKEFEVFLLDVAETKLDNHPHIRRSCRGDCGLSSLLPAAALTVTVAASSWHQPLPTPSPPPPSPGPSLSSLWLLRLVLAGVWSSCHRCRCCPDCVSCHLVQLMSAVKKGLLSDSRLAILLKSAEETLDKRAPVSVDRSGGGV